MAATRGAALQERERRGVWRRRLVVGTASALGCLLLGSLPVRAADVPSAPAGTLHFDDARLFHPAKRLTERVWTDEAKDDSRQAVQLNAADGVLNSGRTSPVRPRPRELAQKNLSKSVFLSRSN